MGGLLDVSELTNAVTNQSQRTPPDESIVERFRNDSSLDVPIELTDLDLWSNYVNDDVYDMDVKVREFLRRTRYQREKKGGYRTTAPMVFAWIYGRQPEPSDGSACRLLHELLRYYCTSYTGKTTYKGKPVNRVYRFSRFATTNKRPYSLRLRLEEAKDVGGAVFRKGPDSSVDKRTHGRPADRKDGGKPAG